MSSNEAAARRQKVIIRALSPISFVGRVLSVFAVSGGYYNRISGKHVVVALCFLMLIQLAFLFEGHVANMAVVGRQIAVLAKMVSEVAHFVKRAAAFGKRAHQDLVGAVGFVRAVG